MIDEKKIIKKKKNCEYVETQREFIHILQIEAKEQAKRKE